MGRAVKSKVINVFGQILSNNHQPIYTDQYRLVHPDNQQPAQNLEIPEQYVFAGKQPDEFRDQHLYTADPGGY